jgi:endogenous inhibitor of DNA gyrase (YacG/DUF329 family)
MAHPGAGSGPGSTGYVIGAKHPKLKAKNTKNIHILKTLCLHPLLILTQEVLININYLSTQDNGKAVKIAFLEKWRCGDDIFLDISIIFIYIYIMTKKNIQRICKECQKPFYATSSEINRGNALFCSLSCAGVYINHQRIPNTLRICKTCGQNFLTLSYTNAKYCSKHCKNKDYYKKMKRSPEITYLQQLPCEICHWDICARDLHHIVSIRTGGTHNINNLVTLCPNCHRMAHRKLLSEHDLTEITKYRTIPSSL